MITFKYADNIIDFKIVFDFLNKDTSSVRTIMYDWSEIRENCNEIPIFELEDGTPHQKRYEKRLPASTGIHR